MVFSAVLGLALLPHLWSALAVGCHADGMLRRLPPEESASWRLALRGILRCARPAVRGMCLASTPPKHACRLGLVGWLRLPFDCVGLGYCCED
jgi:hypothetical protein